MASGPIGSVWAAGTWADTAWEASTWADTTGSSGPAHGESGKQGRHRGRARLWWLIALVALQGLFG